MKNAPPDPLFIHHVVLQYRLGLSTCEAVNCFQYRQFVQEIFTLNKPTNEQIADLLERIADLLEIQGANPFRVRAYHAGADTIRTLDQSVADLVRQTRWSDLKALPNIGEGITALIHEYVSTGQLNLLHDLEAQVGPEAALVQVPGIGPEFAKRIVQQIDVVSLPELEMAAHDGRLETVEGFGERRVEGIRAALAGMLSQSARAAQQDRTQKGQDQEKSTDKPSVALLLDIDAEYRQRAEKDELQKIAPRRFNPENREWLPVMHTKREGWLFTVLFSNTAQAHQLQKTDDWVVIYYEHDGKEQQNTVVTETKGPLEGKRVVRGRSAETQEHYRAKAR